MPTLGQDLRRLKSLKGKESTAKKKAEALTKERKEFEYRCLERMEREDCQSHKTDGSLFVAVPEESSIYGTIQDRAAFVEWAKENEEELIEFKERGDLLNQLVRQRIDDGRPLPPGVGSYSRPYVSIRAA